MCTASWLSAGGTLHLFFNRDELLDREPALPPRRIMADGIGALAPVDGRAGGTWILGTERGLALALLNRSEGRPAPPGSRSRGEIPAALARSAGPDALDGRLAGLDLARYPPFTLLALWRAPAAGRILAWDGHRLEPRAADPAAGILCSSGLGDELARAPREAAWRARRAARGAAWGLEDHRALHASHEPHPHAFSICMHRTDAATVSFVEMELAPERVRMSYRPGSPCAGAPVVELDCPLDPVRALR